MKPKVEKITGWIKKQVEESGAKGIVIGMSGGIDSSVAAALCKKACGNTLGLILPCESGPEDLEDAKLVAGKFGVETQVIDLSEVFAGAVKPLGESDKKTQGNLKARLRMCALYYAANQKNYLVAGSGNKSEISVGYFTKHGDGAADFLPLGGLLKTEVIELAKSLGVPEKIIKKPPSAGLWAGQTDEEEMGFTYAELDRFLSTGEGKSDTVKKIKTMIKKNEHKKRSAAALC
ncbi:MAG: NAD(+) synthase [Candidatus Altiarchaeales archaeon IMC4]|nr:MAG: NAD(+) synthase [Candidatus Altiarchaeales archaeon IMC4]